MIFGEKVFINESYQILIRDYHNLIIKSLRTLIEFRFKERKPLSDLLEFVIEQLDVIIEQNPLNIEALYFLAQCNYWKADYQSSCEISERII